MKRLDAYGRDESIAGIAVPVYTWATLPITALLGQYALVSDSLNGVTSVFPLQYRRNDASYPWEVANGLTPQYAAGGSPDGASVYYSLASNAWYYTGTVKSTAASEVYFTAPAAGVWDLLLKGNAYRLFNAAWSPGVGFSTTNSVAPVSGDFATYACANLNGGVPWFQKNYTLAKNEIRYAWLKSDAGDPTVWHEVHLGARPVKIAGNA